MGSEGLVVRTFFAACGTFRAFVLSVNLSVAFKFGLARKESVATRKQALVRPLLVLVKVSAEVILLNKF